MQLNRLTLFLLAPLFIAGVACDEDSAPAKGNLRGVPGSPIFDGPGTTGVPGGIVDIPKGKPGQLALLGDAIFSAQLMDRAVSEELSPQRKVDLFATGTGLAIRLTTTTDEVEEETLLPVVSVKAGADGALFYRTADDQIVIRDARHVLFSFLEPFVVEDARAASEGRLGDTAAREFERLRRDRAVANGVPGSRAIEGELDDGELKGKPEDVEPSEGEPSVQPAGVPGSPIFDGPGVPAGVPGFPQPGLPDIFVFNFDVTITIDGEEEFFRVTEVSDANRLSIYSIAVEFEDLSDEEKQLLRSIFSPLRLLNAVGPGSDLTGEPLVIESPLSAEQVLGQLRARDIVKSAVLQFATQN